jgi:secretion system chaperone SscA
MSGDSLKEFSTFIWEWWKEAVEEQNQPFLSSTPERLKEMYYIAYRLYSDKRYQDSLAFFRSLTAANPLEAKYWKGLGASLQMLNDYQQALRCYHCIEVLDKEKRDPYLFLSIADCYFGLKQINRGLTALEEAHLQATKQKDSKVLNHVALMRKLWSNNK